MLATNYCCQRKQPGVALYDDDDQEKLKSYNIDDEEVHARKERPGREGRIRIYEVEPQLDREDKVCHNFD
jgi:hypothetical protein